MSILKKLVGFLFEEDEEISEEGELEEISLSEYKKEEKPRAPRYEEEKQEHIRVEDVHVKKTVKAAVQDELPPQEQKHFTNIEIAKEEPKKATTQTTRSTQPQVREKQPRKEAAKQEYEFTPVISPIFGAADTDSKSVKKPASTKKTSSTVTKASKKNPLATIISPIYGASELEEFEEEAKEQQKQEEQPKVDIATINENMIEREKPESAEEEEMENVPLSDLLAKEEVSDTGEDLLQFSLFGDDEVVRTDIKEDSYTIKE